MKDVLTATALKQYAKVVEDQMMRELYPPHIVERKFIEYYTIHDEMRFEVSPEPSTPAYMNPLLLLTTT